MRNLSLSLAGVFCLAGLLSAQAVTGAEPGVIRAMSLSKVFRTGMTGFPGASITQVNTARTPKDRAVAGQFSVGISVQRLTSAYGGDGINDGIVSGIYNQKTKTLTFDKRAIKMTAAGAFGLVIEPKIGLVAVADHQTGPVVAQWNATAGQFGTPKKILGISGTYVDPAVAYIEGPNGPVLTLFWVDTLNNVQGVYMATLDPVNAKITTTPVLVAKGSSTQPLIHSPTPVIGADLNAHGLFCSARNSSGDSDQFWSGDLDPVTPILKVADSTSWLNNGGVAGGTLFFADSANYAFGAQEMGVAWLLGDEAAINTTATITAAAETTNAGSLTVVFLAAGYIAPVAIPGFKGHLGINPAGIVPLPAPIAIPNDSVNMGSTTLAIPNDTTLKGKSVPMQGLYVNVVAKPAILAFTNTTRIAIR